MTQLRIRALKWKNPDGTPEVPNGRTLTISEWVATKSEMVAKVYPAVLEYRNPITGPTEWTLVDVVDK